MPTAWVVVGPTAAGKSDLAVGLARALAGEIVNTDSMQVYRGMDIGTAKLTPAERGGVAHHLLDLWDLDHAASVAEFQAVARGVIAEIAARDAVPVLVGGSGLYTDAVTDDLRFPGTDPAVRARLESELAADGPQALHARLAAVDPVAAAAILPGNGRRIVRALEVHEITGQPFTAWLPRARTVVVPHLRIGLDVPRPELDRRIGERVDRMWAAGFVDEVRALEAHGLRRARTASRALGYAQVLAFLAGECTEDEARTETVRATRRFARRQDAWFRRDDRVRWIDAGTADLVAAALAVAAGDGP